MNNKLDLVNPLKPNEVIKTVELIGKEIPIEEEIITKKKKNVLIYLPIVLLVVIISITYFLINNDNEVYEPTTTILNDISTSLNLENNVTDNRLTVTIRKETEEEKEIKNYEYVLEGNLLKTSFGIDDLDGHEIFMKIADTIGVKNGYNENEVYDFLSNVDFKFEKIEGLNVKLNDNKYVIVYDATKRINLSILEYNYFTVADLKDYNEFIKTSGNVTLKKDNLTFYKTGSNNEAIITIGEYNDFSDLTLKSIVSLANSLYPDEEFEFETLESKVIGRYDISVDVMLDDDLKNIFNNYDEFKFVQIKIKIG